jgi:hypothetical protein
MSPTYDPTAHDDDREDRARRAVWLSKLRPGKKSWERVYTASDGSVWHLEAGPCEGWLYSHEDFDGGPMHSHDESPADKRYGSGRTPAECIEGIEEGIEDGRFG